MPIKEVYKYYDLILHVLGAFLYTSFRITKIKNTVNTSNMPKRTMEFTGIKHTIEKPNPKTTWITLYIPPLTLRDVVKGWNR